MPVECEPVVCEEHIDAQPGRQISSLESPLTFYIRDARKEMALRRDDLLANWGFGRQKPALDTEQPVADDPTAPQAKLADIVGHLQTDGTHFIDSEWEEVINRPQLRMWRRPSTKKPGVTAANSKEEESNFYEYRGNLGFLNIHSSVGHSRGPRCARAAF